MPDQDHPLEGIEHPVQPYITENSSIEYPSFKKAFWLIFILISVIQIIQAYYVFKISLSETVSSGQYLNLEILSITWYLLSVIIIHNSLIKQGLNPWKFYNLDFAIIGKHLRQILKYFAGTAVFVILFALISPETELQLEDKPFIIIFLMLLTVTVIAPVCEELVFRGYLFSSMIPVFKRSRERLVVNAMLFAAAHVFLIVFAIGGEVPYYIFILGYLLARLYQDSRSILPCIILHMLNNSLVGVIDLIKLDMHNTSQLIQALL